MLSSRLPVGLKGVIGIGGGVETAEKRWGRDRKEHPIAHSARKDTWSKTCAGETVCVRVAVGSSDVDPR